MLRELHPGLDRVWDELDELRAGTDSRVAELESTLYNVSKRLADLQTDDEELDEIISVIEAVL